MEIKEEIYSLVLGLPVVHGYNLRQSLGVYLQYDLKNLLKQRGVFEDVLLSRAMVLVRKKFSLIEEVEMQQALFTNIFMACETLPYKELGD